MSLTLDKQNSNQVYAHRVGSENEKYAPLKINNNEKYFLTYI